MVLQRSIVQVASSALVVAATHPGRVESLILLGGDARLSEGA
jgi:hypothetical protein